MSVNRIYMLELDCLRPCMSKLLPHTPKNRVLISQFWTFLAKLYNWWYCVVSSQHGLHILYIHYRTCCISVNRCPSPRIISSSFCSFESTTYWDSSIFLSSFSYNTLANTIRIFLAHRIWISKFLPRNRKSYLTHAILPRLSHEGYIHWLYWNSRTWLSSDVIVMLMWCHYNMSHLSVQEFLRNYSGTFKRENVGFLNGE